HDDRHVAVLAELAADVQARAVRQSDVEQDQVRRLAAGRAQRVGRGRGHAWLEALALESLGERLGDRALVLHKKNHAPAHGPEATRGSMRMRRGGAEAAPSRSVPVTSLATKSH